MSFPIDTTSPSRSRPHRFGKPGAARSQTSGCTPTARSSPPSFCRSLYAAWRAGNTFWHRYELLPDRLRITTGLYRPKIHTEEVDFNTVESVRVEGFRLYRLVNRGDVVLVRAGGLNPVRIEGIKDPEGIKTLIDGALERWRPRSVAR